MPKAILGREDVVAIDRLHELAAHPNTELEIRFKGIVADWDDYRRILAAVAKLKGASPVVTERSMTVSNKNENAYVSGIVRYEKVYGPNKDLSGRSQAIPAEPFGRYVFKKVTGSHEIRWLGLRVVVSLEQPTEPQQDARFNTFRYRLRQSVTVGAWRYDFTRVIDMDLDTVPAGRAKTFAEECNALPVDAEWPCRYELEAERLPDATRVARENKLSAEIFSEDGPVRVVYKAAGRNLTKILIDNTVYPLIREWVPGVRNFRDLMNKPVPLTRERMQHLMEEPFGASLKADGERAYLFAPENLSMVYVLKAAGADPVMYRLVPPGQKREPDEPEAGSYLIDGEIDVESGTFWIFECLVFLRNVTEHRFRDRYNQLRDKFVDYRLVPVVDQNRSWADMAEESFRPMEYVLKIKPFLFSEKPSDIYDIVRKLTEGRRMDGKRDAKAGFGIDGIIFQPANSGYYNKRTYKWKPPEMNSIDFLVRVVPTEPSGKNARELQSLRLYVGTSLATYERFTHNKTFDHVMFPRLPRGANYGPMPFVAPGGQQMSTAVVPRKVMEIEDDTIYEFVYRQLPGPQAASQIYGWVPIRQRPDRTAEYRRGTFFGNNHDVACEAWETIRNPIPLESLTNPVQTGGGYWARPGTPSRTGIGRYTGMVKNEIYTTYIKAGSRLLEISGGRGGDINRWERCRVSQVTNIDRDQAAIDEMYARLNELYRVKPELRESMPVHGVVEDVLTTDFRGEFDAVSCMFAVHYFLRNEADFMRFFNLVDRCLVHGGFLLITSLDGAKVLHELTTRGINTPQGHTLTLGPSGAGPEDLAATIRAPEPLQNRLRDYGQKIAVRVSSIGEEHEEYLVNYTYIHRFFRTRGYNVLQSKSFDQITRKTDQHLTVYESAYISMARYLVLQKK
jgi:hypothetical protein